MTGPEIGSRWRRRSTGDVVRVVWRSKGVVLTDLDATPWPADFFVERWERV